MSQLLETYLSKPVKVVCKDGRMIFGILACVSKPFSIILQNGVCYHPSIVDIDLQFHYSSQFAAKPFLVNLDPNILNSYDNLYRIRDQLGHEQDEAKKQQLELESKSVNANIEQAKLYESEFMKDKYFIGNLVLPGAQIEQILLLK